MKGLQNHNTKERPYTDDFKYIVKIIESRLRSGNVSNLGTPKSGIEKTCNIKLSKKPYYNPIVGDNSFKQKQRNRLVDIILSLPSGSIIVLIDSVDSQVFHLLTKKFDNIKENGEQLPEFEIHCVNGDDDYNTEKSDQYNILRIRADIYDVINKFDNGTKIALVWNDSMSGYFAGYRNQFNSTQNLFKLMYEKDLLHNTIIAWNANHHRHNVSKKYDKKRVRILGKSDRIEKHFEEALFDFTRYGYITRATIIDEIYPENYKVSNGNSTYLYKYRDAGKTQDFIYHEFIISKSEKNNIIIDLTDD